MPVRLKSSAEAYSILDTLCRNMTGKKPSSYQCEDRQLRPRISRSEFDQPAPGNHLAFTARDEAYISAYRAIMDGEEIPVQGIPLSDGKFLYPDRAVIKAAFREKRASFDEETQTLTIIG